MSETNTMKNVSEEDLGEEDKKQVHQDSVPDGGAVGWLQCAGSFFLLLNSFGIINSYGAFQTFYQEDLLRTHSNSEIAWIGSIQAFLNIFLGIVAGPIYDHGHLRLLLISGSLATVIGMILTGLCKEYYQLILAQGVLVGTGAGLLFLPSIAILSQYFDQKLSTATGIASSGSAVGSICFPIMFNQLQPRIGFRNTVWCISLVCLITLLLSLVLLKMRFTPTKVRAVFDRHAWKEGPFVAWAVYLFASLLGLYIPSFYIQQYAATVTRRELAFWTLPALNAGSFFGRLFPLFLGDMVGPLNLEVPFTLIASVLAFAWIGIENVQGVFGFIVVYGFFAGAITTLTAPIDVALSPNLDVVGVRMGMLLAPWGLGLLISTPIAGAILGTTAGWTGLKVFTGVVLTLAAIAGLVCRVIKYGWGLVKC